MDLIELNAEQRESRPGVACADCVDANSVEGPDREVKLAPPPDTQTRADAAVTQRET